MLGKLLKYEWKSSGKITLLLNAYIILITIFGMIMLQSGFFDELIEGSQADREISAPLIIGSLLVSAYFISMIAVAIAVTLFQVFRFYKNFYTDEGYLMHTLPVSSTQLILSKGLVAFGVLTLSSIILMISGFSIVFRAAPAAERPNLQIVFQEMIPTLAREFGWPTHIFIIYLILATILSGIHAILSFYAALSIGQRFAKHKIIGSIIAYTILNMVEQTISIALMFACGFHRLMISGQHTDVAVFSGSIMFVSIAVTLVLIVAYWFITDYTMRKHLNLE